PSEDRNGQPVIASGNWNDSEMAAVGAGLHEVNQAYSLPQLLSFRSDSLTLFRTADIGGATYGEMGRLTQIRPGEAAYQIPNRTWAITDAAFHGQMTDTMLRVLFQQVYTYGQNLSFRTGWMNATGWQAVIDPPSSGRTITRDGFYSYPVGM